MHHTLLAETTTVCLGIATVILAQLGKVGQIPFPRPERQKRCYTRQMKSNGSRVPKGRWIAAVSWRIIYGGVVLCPRYGLAARAVRCLQESKLIGINLLIVDG